MRACAAVLAGLMLLPGLAHAQDPEEPERALVAKQDRDDLAGRWRVLFQSGVTNISVTDTRAESRVSGPSFGFQLSHWMRSDLALDLRFQAVDLEAVDTFQSSRAAADLGFLMGARYHPPLTGGLRPHVGASIGVFSQTEALDAGGVDHSSVGATRLGGTVEGGVDIRIGGHFLLNADGILTLRADRRSRFDLAFGFGFIFGSGRR